MSNIIVFLKLVIEKFFKRKIKFPPLSSSITKADCLEAMGYVALRL